MSYSEAILLGILQGITEFLPVSSSGHLVLFENLFSMKPNLILNIALHFGTLGAIVFYYRGDILNLTTTFWKRYFRGEKDKSQEVDLIWKIAAATVITGGLGLALKKPVEDLFYGNQTNIFLAATFLATGLLLFTTIRSKPNTFETVTWLQALFIGVVQGLAVLPGISRSGITISAALFLGISKTKASRFSFLLAIPAILGATILEARNLKSIHYPLPLLAGVVVSFLVGFLSLIFLIKIIKKGKFYWFSYYLIPLAAATWFVI